MRGADPLRDAGPLRGADSRDAGSNDAGYHDGLDRANEAFATSRAPRLSRVASSHDVRSALPAGLSLPDRPIHVVVPDAAARSQSHLVVSHVWGGEIPPGAFVRVGPSIRVSSPAFTFLQLAQHLDLPGLIRVGYELCGSYSLYSRDERGFCNREPLASPQELVTWSRDVAGRGMRGCRLASSAADQVRGGAESPMEAVLAMLMTLPRRLGGGALGSPELNHRIELPARLGRRLDSRSLRCDLFWPARRLDVEYNSDYAHAGSAGIARDAVRDDVLRELGVTVIRVTRPQMMDFERCLDVVGSVGRFLRARTPSMGLRAWEERARALHSSLLGPKAWEAAREAP